MGLKLMEYCHRVDFLLQGGYCLLPGVLLCCLSHRMLQEQQQAVHNITKLPEFVSFYFIPPKMLL
jgi:hypothetical protein